MLKAQFRFIRRSFHCTAKRGVPKLKGSIPSLRDFLARTQALSAFRALLRATNRLHPGTANERERIDLRNEIRKQFERNRNEQDPATIRYLLAEARDSLKFLGAGSHGGGEAREDTTPVGFSGTTGGRGGGWYGAVSPSDSRDVHGREGQGWPWKRNGGGSKTGGGDGTSSP